MGGPGSDTSGLSPNLAIGFRTPRFTPSFPSLNEVQTALDGIGLSILIAAIENVVAAALP